MKILANSLRAGNVIVHNNDLWVVSKTPERTKPGKGGAYVQVEMKNLQTNIKINERFSSSDHIEKAELEHRDLQFLYLEDNNLVLMDSETFEQILVNKTIIGERLPFLKDNMMLTVQFFEDKPLNIELPQNIVAEIMQTDPVIKGATVTSSYKPAILTNGIKVMVPPYLVTGEKIIIKTEDITFVERAK